MSWYLVWKFLHLSGAILMVGGVFARQIVRSLISKSEDLKTIAALIQGAGLIDRFMVRMGGMAVLVFGIILAFITGAPFFGFLQGASQNWLLLSNFLILVTFLLIPTVFLPRAKKIMALMQEAQAANQVTPQLKAELAGDSFSQGMHFFEIFSLVVIVILMVFKPI